MSLLRHFVEHIERTENRQFSFPLTFWLTDNNWLVKNRVNYLDSSFLPEIEYASILHMAPTNDAMNLIRWLRIKMKDFNLLTHTSFSNYQIVFCLYGIFVVTFYFTNKIMSARPDDILSYIILHTQIHILKYVYLALILNS